MDSVCLSEQGAASRQEDLGVCLPELGFFLLCDGLSAKEGGDQAAAHAAGELTAWATRQQPLITKARLQNERELRRQVEESLRNGLQELSKAIFERAAQSPATLGMCTTVDIILALGTHALVAHVGPGRVYLCRRGQTHVLTEDHTQQAYLRRVGKLAALSASEQALAGKKITRAVGFREGVKVDFLEVELEAGDRLFALTDGVWQAAPEEALHAILSGSGPLAEAAAKAQALVGKGRDNFSTLALAPSVPVAATAPASAEQKLRMLGQVPAFEYLSYQELLKVLATGDLVKFGPGQSICREGDPGGEMMLILAGSAEVTKSGQKIRTLARGDVVGEMSMIDAAPRSACVTAASATNVLAFRRDALFQLFREDPGLAVKFLWGITSQMNQRLRAASNQLVGQPAATSPGPVAGGPLPFHRSL